MAQKLHAYDAADITLVAEFRENGIGSASHSVFEIHTICEVGCYAYPIDNDIRPFGSHLPPSRLLMMERNKHQQGI